MTRVVGIDPGLGGALAILDSDKKYPLVMDMPVAVTVKSGKKSRRIIGVQLAEFLRSQLPLDWAFIERQQAMSKQHVTAIGKTMEGYGLLKGVCHGLRIQCFIFEPTRWKRNVSLQVGSTKDESRELAMSHWPGIAEQFSRKRDDGRAEACLIAHAGMMGIDL